MRIDGTNSTSKTDKTRKKKGADKTGAADAFSAIFDTPQTTDSPIEATQNLVGIQSVLSIDALNVLSNASNQDYIKQENVNWGRDTLKHLEGIKYQILNGKVSYSALLTLQERLKNIPINPTDIKLKDIVQEIEVRAAVELEKLKRMTESVALFKEDEIV
jgi:hypothetical protein